MDINHAFNQKRTENGDIAFTTTGSDNLLNLLFLTEYYSKHLSEVNIGETDRDKLFARFVRDPRLGLGKRDLGRVLMHQAHCTTEEIVKSGRVDDLYTHIGHRGQHELETYMMNMLDYLKAEIEKGNELVKKWMPRYSSKHKMIARAFARHFGMNKQKYGHFIKCDTTESKLSDKRTDEINFEHVPSLALLKYYNRFQTKSDTQERFEQYLQDVKDNKKEMKVSTTTVYDIYKNRNRIDPDLFFDKIEKINISCVPVVDTSGSMWDSNDSYGKAVAIGHYLAKCSSFAPNKVVSFSSRPKLIDVSANMKDYEAGNEDSRYAQEIQNMYTGDCSNTDLAAVMEIFKDVDVLPDYLVILSDMEFDAGSYYTKEELMQMWKERGYSTKLIWWNLNARQITCPEMDSDGNIFLSGYSPMLLKYLEVGFDGKAFLNKLLTEYEREINK